MGEIPNLIKKPTQVNADLAVAEDRDRILELNKLEYGPSDILTTHADFIWHYDRNPAGKAIVPVIRDSRGNVVGFIWIEPLRIRFNKQIYLAATGTSLIIEPEYRNTFAFTKLIRRFERVFEDEGIPLHFSFVSEKRYQQLLKSESKCISTIPLLAKPLDFRSLAHTYIASSQQRFVVSRIGPLLSPFLFRQSSIIPNKEITIQQIDQFKDDFDNFWRQVQDKYPVMLIRDQSFLGWRFNRLSGRDYRTLAAWAGKQMLGYVVIRCSTIHGVKTGLIMDLLVADNKLGQIAGTHLLADAETYFRTQQMSVATALMPSFAAEYLILRRSGYVKVPRAFSPRSFRFAFFVHDAHNKELMSLSARNWFITMADHESR
jgi:hypothetical protein